MSVPCYHTIQAERHLAAVARGDEAFAAAWQSLYDEFMAGVRAGLGALVDTPDYHKPQSTVLEVMSEYLEFVGHQQDVREMFAMLIDSSHGHDTSARASALIERIAVHHANYHADRKMENQQ
jgi:hypothetical protein